MQIIGKKSSGGKGPQILSGRKSSGKGKGLRILSGKPSRGKRGKRRA